MSTTKKNLLPLTDLSKVQFTDKKSGDILIKYLEGMPRQYRFDASNGFFNIKGDERITKKGENLTVIPIAYQIFTDEILGDQYGKMRWLEIIFLNQSLQVCTIFLHGYSVQNFLSKADELFYADSNFCEVKLTIKPVQKTSSNPEANGAKYWMAFFGFEPIAKKKLAPLNAAIKGLKFYRKDTYTIHRDIEIGMNYSVPKSIAKELEEIEDRKKKLIEQAKDTAVVKEGEPENKEADKPQAAAA